MVIRSRAIGKASEELSFNSNRRRQTPRMKTKKVGSSLGCVGQNVISCEACRKPFERATSPTSTRKPALVRCGVGLLMAAAVVIGVLVLGTPARAENVGTSQADLPSQVGRFIVDNQTDRPVAFSVKWGNTAWANYTQAPHSTSTHSHALTGPNQAPQPYVHFGNKEYKVAWGVVGSSGFGPGGNVNNAVRHVFKAGADGSLGLFRQ